MSNREQQFKDMVKEFPDSAMAHFSLGRLYLDEKRFSEAVTPFTAAIALDAQYAAAHVALGDAWAGLSEKEKAKASWQAALETAHGRRDASLQADLEQRIRDIDDF